MVYKRLHSSFINHFFQWMNPNVCQIKGKWPNEFTVFTVGSLQYVTWHYTFLLRPLEITDQNKITLLTNCTWQYAECNPLISSFTVQNIFTGVLTVILRDTKRPLKITNQSKIAFLKKDLFLILILPLHFASGLGRWRLFPDPAPDLVHSGLQRGPVRHASRCHHRVLLQNLHLSESNSYLKSLCDAIFSFSRITVCQVSTPGSGRKRQIIRYFAWVLPSVSGDHLFPLYGVGLLFFKHC